MKIELEYYNFFNGIIDIDVRELKLYIIKSSKIYI